MAASQPRRNHPAGSANRPRLTLVPGGRSEASRPAPPERPRPLRRALASWWRAVLEHIDDLGFPLPE